MNVTSAYKVHIKTRKNDSYIATCLDWPTLDDIRAIVEAEILALQKEAHSYDNDELDSEIEFRCGRIWSRVEEFRRLIDMLRIAVDTNPDSAPYTINVALAGIEIGTISVVPIPVWSKEPFDD